MKFQVGQWYFELQKEWLTVGFRDAGVIRKVGVALNRRPNGDRRLVIALDGEIIAERIFRTNKQTVSNK